MHFLKECLHLQVWKIIPGNIIKISLQQETFWLIEIFICTKKTIYLSKWQRFPSKKTKFPANFKMSLEWDSHIPYFPRHRHLYLYDYAVVLYFVSLSSGNDIVCTRLKAATAWVQDNYQLPKRVPCEHHKLSGLKLNNVFYCYNTMCIIIYTQSKLTIHIVCFHFIWLWNTEWPIHKSLNRPTLANLVIV